MREILLVIYYDIYFGFLAIYYGFLANCCFYSGCILNRIGSCLYWLLKHTYGASGKLFDEAIRIYDEGEKYA